MRRSLLHLTVLLAAAWFAASVSLTYVGMWIVVLGRGMWREHDRYLVWFHWHLCGGPCDHTREMRRSMERRDAADKKPW